MTEEFTRISVRLTKSDYWLVKEALAKNKINLSTAVITGLNLTLNLNIKTER